MKKENEELNKLVEAIENEEYDLFTVSTAYKENGKHGTFIEIEYKFKDKEYPRKILCITPVRLLELYAIGLKLP